MKLRSIDFIEVFNLLNEEGMIKLEYNREEKIVFIYVFSLIIEERMIGLDWRYIFDELMDLCNDYLGLLVL